MERTLEALIKKFYLIPTTLKYFNLLTISMYDFIGSLINYL